MGRPKSLKGCAVRKPLRLGSLVAAHPKSSWQEVFLTICGVRITADVADKELKFSDWRYILKTRRLSASSFTFWSKCGFAAINWSPHNRRWMWTDYRTDHEDYCGKEILSKLNQKTLWTTAWFRASAFINCVLESQILIIRPLVWQQS